MRVLIIIEHNQGEIKSSNYNVLGAALQLQPQVEAIVMGHQCRQIADSVSQLKGIHKVYLLDNEVYQHDLPERSCEAVLQVAEAASHILAPATSFGKNLLPRVAAKLGVGQVSDVIKIINAETFKRPIYAGNAIATVKVSNSQPVCLTIRSTAFSPINELSDAKAEIIDCSFISHNQQSRFVKTDMHQNDRPELASAQIVISGGRGLQNKQTFERLTRIADRLGAAVGASRAAVDSGLAPNDFQVGQTGQIVAPTLYFAVGISGAIQHLAGMKDSKIIVAINKDPDAPIFQIAHYGIVADLNEVLSEWETILTEMGY
ncbi:MAG: electron transfer flavoprotein subunit beta [Gammaproteobacteria bacterium RIFCSPHIGHO2_12_FULL_41_15]|nr:MAG: electron transfer flavoprotein subunit beta [Gammaproteobacteria bacterium RIFCSPHIGHO2_12_FULL_41_15]